MISDKTKRSIQTLVIPCLGRHDQETARIHVDHRFHRGLHRSNIDRLDKIYESMNRIKNIYSPVLNSQIQKFLEPSQSYHVLNITTSP
jgi:hypothetical protein